jgi:predicted dehydrogenase
MTSVAETRVTSDQLRIGILGAGRRGRDHVRSILALPHLYHLAAVCDVSADSATSVAALASARAYTRPSEFLARERLDVVVITTPRETHHLAVKLVAEHGSHMLIETPLATTRAMMDCIEETASHHALKIEVAENMWRRAAERLNRQVIDEGHIGDVLRVTSFYGPAGGNSCYHTMSLMRSYAGADVAEVQALTQPYDAGSAEDAETWTQGVLRYENDVIGSVTYTSNWTSALHRGHPRVFSVEGTAGFLIAGDCPGHMLRRVEDGVARDYPKRIETSTENGRDELVRLYYETDPQLEFRNPFGTCLADDGDRARRYDELARASELASLHRAVTTGCPPDYGTAQARRDMELSILLAESAHRHTPLAADGTAVGRETNWEREQHESFRRAYGADPIQDVDRLIAAMG